MWSIALLAAVWMLTASQSAGAQTVPSIHAAVVPRGWAPACQYWDGGFTPLPPGPVTLGFWGDGYPPQDKIYIQSGRAGDPREGWAIGIAVAGSEGSFACTAATPVSLPLPGHGYSLPILAVYSSVKTEFDFYHAPATDLLVPDSIRFPVPGTFGTPAFCAADSLHVAIDWLPADQRRMATLRVTNLGIDRCVLALYPVVHVVAATQSVDLGVGAGSPASSQDPLAILVSGETVHADFAREKDTARPLPTAPHTYQAMLFGTGEFALGPPPNGAESPGADLPGFDFPLEQLVQPIVPSLPAAGSAGDMGRRSQGQATRAGAPLIAGLLLLLASPALFRRSVARRAAKHSD
ncbi:MAG: hypothetical protein ACYDCQ_13450 [Dehalococcoidia bacterium]